MDRALAMVAASLLLYDHHGISAQGAHKDKLLSYKSQRHILALPDHITHSENMLLLFTELKDDIAYR
jgi:hypothetical protein